jgi:argonaute-like protein implicated in RNA metabolism and viral defense
MLNTTYLGREIVRRDNVKVEGTFNSVYVAEDKLRKMGYVIGSMCGGEPIGFADADKYNYISKWRNMDREDQNKVDGVMISSDWREGSVEIIWFKEPKVLIE